MKKVLLMILAVMNIVILTSCGNTNSEIATMRGGKIRVNDLYQNAFRDPKLGRASSSRKQANEQALREMIIKQVFLEVYGEKVPKEMIEEAYTKQEETYGGREKFEKALQASGLTKKEVQNMLKEALAIEVGLKAHMEIGETEIDAAWEDFHQSVEAQLIKVSDESKAKEILKELQEGHAVFEEVAKEQSKLKESAEEGGKITFDSSTEGIPSEVKKAAFSLKNEEISDVIPVINPVTNQKSYYIVKMVANEGKGNDRDGYLEKLTEIAQQTLLDDPRFVSKVIGKELKEAAIEIKDERFNDLLSDYMDEVGTNETEEDTTESS
ncbi:foldase protein PrsA [Enterococcus casseliflavus]|uniref:peptidylprolyl isomerase n=1 Tax=Enterococcus casseliflavus TaxID=37734 RepID=UPI0008F289CD|nr:peptidylprolyl isomerase [Enterococcus casseliflavus]SFE57254.1 foldase protein PrsA [Enterococcus casseliflavus]